MNDEAIVTIKAGTEIGLGLLDDPEGGSFLDEPDTVLPAGRLLGLMLEMTASRLGEAGHYIVYADVAGRWCPVDRPADDDNCDADALLWTLARFSTDLSETDVGRRVVAKLDPTPEYLVTLGRRRSLMGTTQLGWVDPPGTLGFEDDKIARRIGLLLGVRLDWIGWAEPSGGRKEPMLCFGCEGGVARAPLRSVRGQTPVFRGGIPAQSGIVPRRMPRGDWDVILAVMGVIVDHDVLGDKGRERLRARHGQASAATPAV